jgi:hypothetical protein
MLAISQTAFQSRTQIKKANTALQDNGALGGHLSLQSRNMGDIAIFYKLKVSPYFWGSLGDRPKSSLKKFVIGAFFNRAMYLSKLLMPRFYYARHSLSLHFLEQILLHLGKLNLRNDPLLF